VPTRLRNGLGLLAIDQDRPQDAVKEFEQATTIDSTNASYWANLGNARRAVHDTAGAEHAYRRALEVDPHTADAVNGLGVLLVETKRPAEAVPLFEQALAVAPDFQEARLNLGIALQQSGQNARAEEVYRQVLAAPARYKRERDAAAHLLASLSPR
jgi:Tfp pilus assembly protein PilF